jgi:hypothetical protein
MMESQIVSGLEKMIQGALSVGGRIGFMEVGVIEVWCSNFRESLV